MRIECCRVGFRGPDRKGPRQSGKDGVSSHLAEGETMLHSHFVVAILNEVLEVLGVKCITIDCMDYEDEDEDDDIQCTGFTKRY